MRRTSGINVAVGLLVIPVARGALEPPLRRLIAGDVSALNLVWVAGTSLLALAVATQILAGAFALSHKEHDSAAVRRAVSVAAAASAPTAGLGLWGFWQFFERVPWRHLEWESLPGLVRLINRGIGLELGMMFLSTFPVVAFFFNYKCWRRVHQPDDALVPAAAG